MALFEGGVGHPRSRGILEFHAGHASGKLTILDRGTAFFADTDTFVSTVLDTAVLHFQITLHNIQTVVAGVLEQAVDHATFAAVEVQGVHRCVQEAALFDLHFGKCHIQGVVAGDVVAESALTQGDVGAAIDVGHALEMETADFDRGAASNLHVFQAASATVGAEDGQSPV